ncbi:MAG: pilus assembly protein, partial [Chloroflexi bacterium]|nr:pilus assembly protein [Chloroflexota bacterium]
MNQLDVIREWSKQRGQALVEAALMFPIFLIIIAGVVEVSQLVVTQNRVTDATRSATRFAANGGQDEGMLNMVFNAVTGTLTVNNHVWDIWSVRATINDNGDAFSDWEFTHIFGYSNTIASADVSEAFVQGQVLSELQKEIDGRSTAEMAGGLKIVGTYVVHDVETLLGLEATPALPGFNSLKELIVMRVAGIEINQNSGCSAFPIAVSADIRSVTPPGEGAWPYPDANEFKYPDPPPAYETFFNHT